MAWLFLKETGFQRNIQNLKEQKKVLTNPGHTMTNIRENLENIKAALAAAAQQSPAKTPPVLVAVSKGHDSRAAGKALAVGHRVFGENRVQEAEQKWPPLKQEYPDVELHLIGPLQTNKVKGAVRLFDVIQTLDRPKLARVLAREMETSGRFPKLLVQVNTGEEQQKGGVAPQELGGFLKQCSELGLKVEGLMCIPPVDEEPAMHFALLKKLGRRFGLKELSMGMSQDYETAAALGATHVRVGTVVFGPRGP